MKTARIVKALALASALLYVPAASGQVVEPGAFNHDFLITSVRVAGPLDLAELDPASSGWSGKWAAAPPTAVNLKWKITATVNLHVFSDTSGTRVLDVQSVNDGDMIAFRYSFADPTQSDSIADVPRFHDSVAVTVPFGLADSPIFIDCVGGPQQFDLIHMGNHCNGTMLCCPTGHLFWRADKGTRNPNDPTGRTVPGLTESEILSSNGQGTIHELAETDVGIVTTWQAYDQTSKRWTVVVVRPLVSPPPLPPVEGATIICKEGIVGVAPLHPSIPCTPVGNLPQLTAGLYQIVFANWDGGIQERNGMKYISVWGDLLVK